MHTFDPESDLTADQQDRLLDDLEVRCQTNVATVRDSEPRRRHATIDVLAGNACDRDGPITTVQAGELGPLSATGISSRPVMVGSVYLLQLDPQLLPTGSTLAVCDRCVMLGDSSYELRFRFPSPLELNDD